MMRYWMMVLLVGTVATAGALAWTARADAEDADFRSEVALSGLMLPTNVEFAPDGRVFVAEKAGVVKVFDSLDDPTPEVFVDLRDRVHNWQDRGLLALELHPDWGSQPYVYVGFTYDGPMGSTAPVWGNAGDTFDDCPNNPEGGNNGECLASTQILRFDASTNTATDEHLVLWEYCEPNRTHAVGDLQFAPDGSLYLSHGDSAWGSYINYGQRLRVRPPNQCGDANGSVGVAPTLPDAEGGMLRAQDLRTRQDPTGLAGSIIRIDPATGAAVADNPLGADTDVNAARIVAFGLRQPFRFTFRPGTDDLYVADVGWSTWEEINRVPNPPSRPDAADPNAQRPDNFGWPCYEGTPRMPGMDALGVTICEDLYTDAAYPARGPLFSYNHGSPTVAGGSCAVGGHGSNGGIAFYDGDRYPTKYHGALFFADYARGCIYALAADSNGIPIAGQAMEVIAVSSPVDLEAGPGDDLYYLDVIEGTLNRLVAGDIGSSPAPSAALNASARSGAVPLEVTFDASGSTDPLGLGLSYQWDFNGDAIVDRITPVASTSWTYPIPGETEATLTIVDANGRTDTASVRIVVGDEPPVPRVLTPSGSTRWAVGDRIQFTGTAVDPEDGTLDGAGLEWTFVLHHCPAGEACHSHIAGGGTGSEVELNLPEHEMDSWLEAVLVATDRRGSTGTTSLRLDPRTVDIDVGSTPAGAPIVVNDHRQPAPFSSTVIANSTNTVIAPPTFADGPHVHEFSRWSIDGEAALTLIAASDIDLVAIYSKDPDSLTKAGYWLLDRGGHTYPFGEADDHGDVGVTAGVPAVAIVATRANDGFWVLHADGRVTAHGAAVWHGDLSVRSAAVSGNPTVIAGTPDEGGYWIFTDTGAVAAFGSAASQGDLTHLNLQGGIVAASITTSGGGYLLVGADGGVFALGDAKYLGSVPEVISGPLNQKIVGIATASDGSGYWLVAADGGLFAFGAPFRGSVPEVVAGPLNQPVVGVVPYGDGYLLVASDGGVFVFSNLEFAGSLGGDPPPEPVQAIAAMF